MIYPRMDYNLDPALLAQFQGKLTDPAQLKLFHTLAPIHRIYAQPRVEQRSYDFDLQIRETVLDLYQEDMSRPDRTRLASAAWDYLQILDFNLGVMP